MLQEIDIVKGLALPNVPRIIESGIVTDDTVSEDALYIVEQYVDGISLRDWLNAGNTADLPMAYRILHTLLSVEIELEKSGILHRDINPNNIILGKDGLVYLIDFGLAKRLGGHRLLKQRLFMVPLHLVMHHMNSLQILSWHKMFGPTCSKSVLPYTNAAQARTPLLSRMKQYTRL